MIYYVATERFSSTIRRFLRHHGKALGGILRSLTWEELFFERGGPIGHYIFTDFDRLSRYEIDCAASFALALEKAAPEARILNHPLRALERFPLLVALHKAGINDFTATRIEAGGRPPKYPVFIRAEDGYGGPETDILHNDAEFDAALADLRRRGLPLRGRIAIGYAAERSPDGLFRKYGAFNIAGTIVPYHLMRNRGWVVKRNLSKHDFVLPRDEEERFSAAAVAEETEYVVNSPHSELLAEVFQVAGIDFGRADYALVDGRIQVYEINTNPEMPTFPKVNARTGLKRVVRARFAAAMAALDLPMKSGGRIGFPVTKPRAHNLHLPRLNLPISVARRMLGILRN